MLASPLIDDAAEEIVLSLSESTEVEIALSFGSLICWVATKLVDSAQPPEIESAGAWRVVTAGEGVLARRGGGAIAEGEETDRPSESSPSVARVGGEVVDSLFESIEVPDEGTKLEIGRSGLVCLPKVSVALFTVNHSRPNTTSAPERRVENSSTLEEDFPRHISALRESVIGPEDEGCPSKRRRGIGLERDSERSPFEVRNRRSTKERVAPVSTRILTGISRP